MTDNNKIVQEFGYLLHENRAMIRDLSNHLANLNEFICDADTKVIETWSSYKKLRDSCERKIEYCQKELLKWIKQINERLQDHKMNLDDQEKNEKFERLEERIRELKTAVEKEITESLIGSFYVSDLSLTIEYYDYIDPVPNTDGMVNEDMLLHHQDILDNRDLRGRIFEKIKSNELNVVKLRDLINLSRIVQ